VESNFLEFESAEITQLSLRRLSETNIKKFGTALSIGPDPGNNPRFLELKVDYYQSWTVPAIGRFLGVTIKVYKNHKIIERYDPPQAFETSQLQSPDLCSSISTAA